MKFVFMKTKEYFKIMNRTDSGEQERHFSIKRKGLQEII